MEVIAADGGEPKCYTLTKEGAKDLFCKAFDKAKTEGFGWKREPIRLKPSPKLAGLIRESRRLSTSKHSEAEEEV